MKRSKAAWRAGGLMAVAIVAIVNVVQTARKIPPPMADSPFAVVDRVTQQERRLGRLRQRLDTDGVRGIVGYFGDSVGPELGKDSRQVEDFYLAQFVLVPIVLDPNPVPHRWAVMNLRSTSSQQRVPAGWRMVEDFGDGVLLLGKAAP